VALPAPDPGSAALVTGASSGLGAAMARELAGRGHGVILVARGEERLRALAEELAGRHRVRAEAVACDLTDPMARDRLQDEVERLGVRVDVLVANAGWGTYKPFAETPRERVLDEVRVNTEAVVDLAARWLPGMVQRGAGAMLVTASTAGFQPLPGNAVYSAGKAFALCFAEAVQQEVRGRGVTVTALCPGFTRTEFHERMGVRRGTSFLWMETGPLVTRALSDFDKGRVFSIPGAQYKAIVALTRIIPSRALQAYQSMGRK
jgi:uncharacterized protein